MRLFLPLAVLLPACTTQPAVFGEDMEVDVDDDSCVITHTWALYAD